MQLRSVSKITGIILILLASLILAGTAFVGITGTRLFAADTTMTIETKAVDAVVNTDYVLTITDIANDQQLYTGVHNSTVATSSRMVNNIQAGKKYKINSVAPAGYTTQIWIKMTDAISGENTVKAYNNSVLLEIVDGVTYNITIYMMLESMAWFGDYTVF